MKNLSPTLSELEAHKNGSLHGSGHSEREMSYLNKTVMQISGFLIVLITLFMVIRIYMHGQYRDIQKPKEKEEDFDGIPLNES